MLFAIVGFICAGAYRGDEAVAGPPSDVQRIGLPPLYEALFAVANCRNVAIDGAVFVRAAGLYHLSTTDLTAYGPFSADVLALDAAFRLRFEDDPAAFCSASRLQFAIPYGILVDRGPVVPHPLPPIGLELPR